MNYRKLTIGQMADINQVSQQTLRHYDTQGLLVPATVDEKTGYRYYNIMQSARLDMIQYMKSLDISLSSIKSYLDGRDTGRVVNLLMEKHADIDRHILRLQQQKKAIRRMVESIQRYESAPPDGTIVLEYIGSRFIYSHDTGFNFYNGGIEVYEQMLRQLKEQMRGVSLPEIYFYNAGTILRKEQLLRRNFHSSEVFVSVDDDYDAPGLLTQLPASTYYCIYCYRFDHEKEYALRLLEYVEQNGLKIAGDYLCEVLFEPPVSSNAQRDMLMRLQVPISYR
ncbi:MAG: MerR family transcriptional regulator [Oscillospiraceae bacterium]